MHPWNCATRRTILAPLVSANSAGSGFPPAVPAPPFALDTPTPPNYPPFFPYGPLPAGAVGTNSWGPTNTFPFPTDCLRVLAIGDDAWYRIEGRNVMASEQSIKFKYIFDLVDTTQMDELLGEAIACYLAWDIAYSLTQSVQGRDIAWKSFELIKRQAKSVDAQEERDHVMTANLFTDSRINRVTDSFEQRGGED